MENYLDTSKCEESRDDDQSCTKEELQINNDQSLGVIDSNFKVDT